MQATVGEVSAGLGQVSLRDLRIERNGAVLTLPAVEADLPLLSALRGRGLLVSRLAARGWTLDLSRAAGEAPGGARPAAPAGPDVAARILAGTFAPLGLPVDTTLDGIEVDGAVVLPERRGRARLVLKGGGLRAGGEGRFDLVATAELADPGVNKVEIRGEVRATMDTTGTFTRLAAKLAAAATGTQFPSGVHLNSELETSRTAGGETYSASIVTAGRELVQVRAALPRPGARLEGAWTLNVRDTDLAPFSLGHPLPSFAVTGEGRFETDATLSARQIQGRIEMTAGRLGAIRPELAAMGEIRVVARFDGAERAGTFAVQAIQADISAPEPVATLRSLQSFAFRPETGELSATDAGAELFGVAFHGVPAGWLAPFFPGVEVTGGRIRGEIAGTARGGGVGFRSTAPLTIDGMQLTVRGTPLLAGVDVALNASGDYTPHGWQAEIVGATVRSGGGVVAALDGKAGRLAGAAQPVKVTGRFTTDLQALSAQPLATGRIAVSRGDAAVDFVGSFAEKTELQARLTLRSLVTGLGADLAVLPDVSAEVRADVFPTGRIAFDVPLVIERDTRKTEFAAAGSVSPAKGGLRGIEAQFTGAQVYLDDLRVLAGLLPDRTGTTSGSEMAAKPAGPPWAGLTGSIGLRLQRVVYAGKLEATAVTGRLRIEEGVLKLEGLQAGLEGGGRARLNSTLSFSGALEQPYALAGEFSIREWDLVPFFRAVAPRQAPTVEGRFDVTSRIAARGATLGELAHAAAGDLQLTSKGGVFRGLPVQVETAAESMGRIAGWISSAGTALGSLTGRKEAPKIASRAEAVAEFSKTLHPIRYDQLSIVLARDGALRTSLRDFTLISPELRLAGRGSVAHRMEGGLLEDALEMDFTLRVRGRPRELLHYLGALESRTDDFGYTAAAIPLRIGGSLAQPETSELNRRLAALAVEKGGVTEKAAELLQKLRGGK